MTVLDVALKNIRRTTCGKAGPSVAVIVCRTWSGGTIYGNKISVGGPGDHLRRDRTIFSVTGQFFSWQAPIDLHKHDFLCKVASVDDVYIAV